MTATAAQPWSGNPGGARRSCALHVVKDGRWSMLQPPQGY